MRARLLALLLAAALPAAAKDAPDPIFDGVWEGTLDVVDRYDASDGRQYDGDPTLAVRIEIRGKRVTVKVGDRMQGSRIDGGYRIDRYDAAALVYAKEVSWGYISTAQYSLTKTQADEML